MAKIPSRIKLELSFQGSRYRGFQTQAKGPTVQKVIESALKKIDFPPKIVGCSRTDGGVHARRYTAHFADTCPGRKCDQILKGLNSNLSEDIAVYSTARVEGDFHARYSCIEKNYRYFLFLGDTVPPPIAPFVSRTFSKVSIEKAVEIVESFVGKRDFRAFTTAEGRKSSTVRDLTSVSVMIKEPLLCIEVTGRSFLHRMVRFIAGAVLFYSRGKISKDFLDAALKGECDFLPFPALEAKGLHLWDTRYPELKIKEKSEIKFPLSFWPFESVLFNEVCQARIPELPSK